jgi:hypothetical protein
MALDETESAAPKRILAPTARGGENWLAAPSRFADWSRRPAVLALLLLALVALTGMLTPNVPMRHDAPTPTSSAQAVATPKEEAKDADLILYEKIIAGIRDGGEYYAVAARELRLGGYPLRPFVAFRPPLLAEALAHMSPFAGLLLLRALVAAVALTWAVRLKEATGSPAAWAIACLLTAGGVALFGQAYYMTLHEIWAGLLIALSLGLRKPDHWVGSVIAGLLAMLIRELAFPYVAVMAALALWEGKKREAAAWAAAIVLFAIATGFHAAAASAAASLADHASQGWSRLGGWSFFLTAVWLTGPLRTGPYLLVAALTPLALLGWAGWREPIAARVFATLVGYALMMMLFGRPDNFYWALIFTPLLMVGLIFAPRSLGELVASARGRHDRTPSTLGAASA